MDTAKLTKMAIALGMCYALYRFGPGQVFKAAAIGVGGVIVAKQVPYLSDALA
jgi:hypothetical protein